MNFIDSAKSGFVNIVNFSGRSTRSEYVFWMLFQILVGIAFGVVGAITHKVSFFSGLVTIIFLLPTLSLTVRRLHDIGKSGWWLFGIYVVMPLLMLISTTLQSKLIFSALGLLFGVSYLVLLGLLVFKGSDDDNRYGPMPF